MTALLWWQQHSTSGRWWISDTDPSTEEWQTGVTSGRLHAPWRPVNSLRTYSSTASIGGGFRRTVRGLFPRAIFLPTLTCSARGLVTAVVAVHRSRLTRIVLRAGRGAVAADP